MSFWLEEKELGLKPLTDVTNKHLLPVYDKPMIFYPIKTLVDAGITEILIVVSGRFAGHFIGLLKNGKELGITKLQYAFQEGNGGIADALKLAEDFADGDDICVILGDNTTDADISKEVNEFITGSHLFLKEVHDPERFGVAEIYYPRMNFPARIVSIEEKPKNPKSNLAVTGLYIYDSDVFSYIKRLKPSDRGELEITDVNNLYLKCGDISFSVLDGHWQDCGTPESLFKASEYWRNKSEIGRS